MDRALEGMTTKALRRLVKRHPLRKDTMDADHEFGVEYRLYAQGFDHMSEEQERRKLIEWLAYLQRTQPLRAAS